MADIDKIQGLLFKAIDEVNAKLPDEGQIEKSIETPLFGVSSNLDSLGLTYLVVAAERLIEAELNAKITIMDETALKFENNPFKTVRTLAEHVCSIV